MFDTNARTDVRKLMQQIGSTRLPPVLNYFQNIQQIMNKMELEEIPIYKQDKVTHLCSINTDDVKVPSYIFHKGAEPISYFTYKNNLSKREMGIANPVWFFTFIYNMIVANQNWLEQFYQSNSFKMVRYHSNSPILGRINRFKFSPGFKI